jgi:hypothetical protein
VEYRVGCMHPRAPCTLYAITHEGVGSVPKEGYRGGGLHTP